MRMRRAASRPGLIRPGISTASSRPGLIRPGLLIVLLLTASGLAAQVTFEKAMTDLASPDAATRLRTVQMLRDAAYPESAIPLAKRRAITRGATSAT